MSKENQSAEKSASQSSKSAKSSQSSSQSSKADADKTKKEFESKGRLSVDTENIFPIIKKWLYSDEDIFIRELVSNSHDAIKKLDHLEDIGKCKQQRSEALISIDIDKAKRTIVIADNGVGMDREEVERYINQIAFSGAKEFMQQYEKSDGIIGHFGLGFFSSFMISEKVEIETLSYKENAKPVHWVCDGSTSFSMGLGDRKEIGTSVFLYVDKDHDRVLDEEYIKNQVIRFSNFLPVAIKVNGKVVNDQNPLWQKKPKEITEEEYQKFYEKLFPGRPKPLLHIHLEADHPFHLKGILFFPEIMTEFDFSEQDKIKLYCNNVFVSDNVSEILPRYLNLLHGVLDSPDIPLNVSRSFLQTDARVKKISSHIVKKVVDKLKESMKKDRAAYEKIWEKIHPIIKFAVVQDRDFYEKVKDILLLKMIDGSFVTLDEYKTQNEKLKGRIIYASDQHEQIIYIEKVQALGVKVALMDHRIDSHFIQALEMHGDGLRFSRVDSDSPAKLVSGDIVEPKEEKDKYKALTDYFENFLKKTEEHVSVRVEELSDKSQPAMRVVDEQMRRLGDMSIMMENKMKMPLASVLVLNIANPIVTRVHSLLSFTSESEKKNVEKEVADLTQNIIDISLLQQGKLAGEQLKDFSSRMAKIVETSLKSDKQ